MKPLTINIKQEAFDQILAGAKTVVTRDIKPANASKYVNFIDLSTHTEYKKWIDIPDSTGDIHIKPIKYDSIRFIARRGKEMIRSFCLVDVKDAEVLFMVDEADEQVYYDEQNQEFPAMCIDYFLGAVSAQGLYGKQQ